jgi:hypothetical protein
MLHRSVRELSRVRARAVERGVPAALKRQVVGGAGDAAIRGGDAVIEAAGCPFDGARASLP